MLQESNFVHGETSPEASTIEVREWAAPVPPAPPSLASKGPPTADRDLSAAEIEFMQAIQDYKRSSGRMFPTWSEVLEVLRNLGYQKEHAQLEIRSER
ncbi:hypothetical protein BH23PLA1_BH23PLA1_19290 [soil metagenome]